MDLPESVDLYHHLSQMSRARKTSPLKGLQRYFEKPGIISLAGGLPSPDYFPFSSIEAQALLPDSFPVGPTESNSSFSWLWSLFSPKKEKTSTVNVPKYPSPTKPNEVNLATALQYGMAAGLPQLQEIIREFTLKIYKPGYSDFKTLVHVGNTDGWMKAIFTFCNPGEAVLACKWTYPSAMASMMPNGITPIPVAMDSQGMSADSLRDILSNWDPIERTMARPHVMYTIPVGQNPTGTTMEAARKKEIYDLCVQYDIIIVEDDPYYFLQGGTYVPPSRRSNKAGPLFGDQDDDDAFFSHLAPSYLRFDYQGRVVRLDSFSKIIAPGCRMGWFTCNPIFAERLERQAEISTQGPCGFGQSIVTATLLQWGFKGYVRWIKGLRNQYTIRRDFFIDCLAENFHLELGQESRGAFTGCNVYHAYSKRKSLKESIELDEKTSNPKNVMFSFVPPTSGMFVWLILHLDQYPKANAIDTKELEMKLWVELAEAGVLFAPGQIFAANGTLEDSDEPAHFRVSFSNAKFDSLKKATSIFAEVLENFYHDI